MIHTTSDESGVVHAYARRQSKEDNGGDNAAEGTSKIESKRTARKKCHEVDGGGPRESKTDCESNHLTFVGLLPSTFMGRRV